ncbi:MULTISPECIES: ATP-binding cassette domain-containing protein [Streptomyces]|uniref:ATP-binding cassette domain-containing protein n=1 Tax=Streptomyces olivaceus TaxID=47716 RepID=A0ABS7W0P0_STROV|nr:MULTISPECIES: ATP-binding cassette domain-containing protein [Streptomyces]AOW88173.1 multidrug ABC transporter ATP-binding protein [Streptomyces olivaceus]MBZ6085020.1 ATP-binding cassette domain-containing protein [Streptomyces olivaceus]MBZ6088911.1 ATP-binding cassette domain-containing protein [Streptomyces olivaceus]MBZ6095715.1 ATP-binding cassette domain-containing protein [Streptomyces olivaceus]MBZ6111699.1 ATP-binding cassette domain-containing protein [Streptomyces olivaceus]
MIEVRELTKRYGKVRAVDGLSFRVEPGRVTGFLGPNGAGKSTAIRAMVGLDRPTSGEVLVDGKRYEDLPRPLTTVGALLDARAVHGGRSVRGHLAGLARSNRLPARRVDELLETVGLASVADKRAKGLSLGMSQRLGIAAALLGDPQTLLLDEPVNGLDPEGVKWVRDLVKRVAGEGRAVLISSHLMSEMALTADHLIVIGRGRLLADTPAHDFITGNSRSYVLIRTPEPERMRDLLAARGVQVDHGPDGSLEAVGTDQKTVGTLAAESRIALYEVTTTTASLEDAFMQFTADSVEYRAEQGAAR